MKDRITISLLSFGLVANLLPSMSFPATMPAVVAELGLTASEAGWIGGIYFAGYAGAVPVLSTLTDRIGAKSIYLTFCLLGAISSLAFAVWAGGFWLALILRFIGGIALAGVHMPGLKLLTDLLGDGAKIRGAGIYASSYALGSASSYLVAGVVEAMAEWPAVFAVAAVGPMAAAMFVVRLSSPSVPRASEVVRIELRPLLRNRSLMSYVLAYAGNTWEVFSVRVWFVAYLAWLVSQPGNGLELPPLAVVSGLAAMVGVPASLCVSEFALRIGREKAILWTCCVSVIICLGLAASTGASSMLVLPLLILVQISSFADVGSLTAGAVASSDVRRRGSSLALFAFAGTLTGFLGPVVVGVALDWSGGLGTKAGWTAAFLVMALGSTAAAIVIWRQLRHVRQAP